MEKKTRKIVYLSMLADLFHYGNLHLLKKSKELGDYLICGIETDELVKSYEKKTIHSFNERRAVISNIKGVNKTIPQDSLDPSENLKKIHKKFPNSEIILIHANKRDKLPEKNFLESINGKIVKIGRASCRERG